jgi:hypothetical protein
MRSCPGENNRRSQWSSASDLLEVSDSDLLLHRSSCLDFNDGLLYTLPQSSSVERSSKFYRNWLSGLRIRPWMGLLVF